MRLTSEMLKVARHLFGLVASSVAWFITGPVLSESVRGIFNFGHYLLYGNTGWIAWGTYYVPLRSYLETLAYNYGCWLGTSLGIYLSLKYGDKLEQLIRRLCTLFGIEVEMAPAARADTDAAPRGPSPDRGQDRDPAPAPTPVAAAASSLSTALHQSENAGEGSPRRRSATFTHGHPVPPLQSSVSATLLPKEGSPRARSGSGSVIPILRTTVRTDSPGPASPTRDATPVAAAQPPNSPTSGARSHGPDTPSFRRPLLFTTPSTISTSSPSRTNGHHQVASAPMMAPTSPGEPRSRFLSNPVKFEGSLGSSGSASAAISASAARGVSALVDVPSAQTPTAALRERLTSPRPGSGQFTPMAVTALNLSNGSSKAAAPAAPLTDRSNGARAASGSAPPLVRHDSSGALPRLGKGGDGL